MKLCLRCNQYFDEPTEKCPTDGNILEDVGKDPLIGALINNRYLVDSVIGKGSSGIVYKARRLGRSEMVVAIKVLHSYIGAAGAALDRFLREAQAASKLRNPHIITIWDSGVTEDGQPYFVMDYLEGTTLGYLIKERGNLEPKRVLSLLHQICEALAEAHRQGIVHRDLKPENVVLQESHHGHDYIKLLDFGIADSPQHAQTSFKLEKPRTVSGSPAYMSPEQCQGFELDGRSDIYSLAIVAFEMLTGCRPFPQKDNINVMVLHVNEPPMTMSSVRPDLKFPQEVENVIARALSKQPSERQASVQDFLLEFELAWHSEDNPLSALARAVGTQTNISNSNLNQLDKNEYASAVTADQLAIQEGDKLTPSQPSDDEVTWVKEKIAEIPQAPDKEIEQFTASTTSPAAATLQESIKDQSITRGKTVDRLIEAAKRGQTGAHPKLSQRDLPNAEIAKPIDLEPNKFSPDKQPLPDNIPLSASTNITPNPVNLSTNPYLANLEKNISESPSPTPSGWYPIPSQPVDSTANVQANPLNTPLTNLPADSSSPVLSYRERALKDSRLSTGINKEIPFPVEDLALERQSGPVTNKELLVSAKHASESAHSAEFYIKQRYRNTLSRLEGRSRPRQADSSLVSTRARAAALKAETVRPPLNLWRFAIAIITIACLLASGYVVYSALNIPVPPVTSVELLLTSGNYAQVIDILEGKKLSDPLDQLERDQLSSAYLGMAKQNLGKKPDIVLSYLNKIDPKSPAAVEGNELKSRMKENEK